jgi:HAD superfamily hydrolase (TIGR01509 family)
MDERALGKRLQLARRRAGLTQQELCQVANLSYSTLAKIERGAIKSPSVFTVAAIASATGVDLEDLLELKNRGFKTMAGSNKKRSKTGVRFVYFDVNGTLVRFFHRAFTEVARETHNSPDTVETVFWRYNDIVCRGQMSLDEFNDVLSKELDVKNFDWQKHYMANVESMPHVDELVKWAAEHYEVGLMSNNMPGFIDQMRKNGIIPNLNYTSVIDSSKIGAVKPELRIYEAAQQLANVEPKEILLIDDSRTNLIVADKLDWRVQWFDDYNPEESIERVRDSLAF